MALNQFISQILEHSVPDEAATSLTVSEHEATLLQNVNLDISPEKWTIYMQLKEKRQQKQLSAAEQSQFIALIDDIENANARRIATLAELAQLRNIPIRTLMEQLGLTAHHE